MASFASVLRLLLLSALAAGSLLLAGCQSGVTAGEGVGVKSFTDGELIGNVPGNLDAATAVVMQTLVEMGVLNATDRRDSVMIEINAKTLDEKTLQIRVSRLSDDLTRLRIRAGEGEEAAARAFFQRVRARLQLQFG